MTKLRIWFWIAAVCLPMVPQPVVARDLLHAVRAAVQIRAVRKNVSGDVVRFVATNTEPLHLDPANFDTDSAMTPSEIITRLCGLVREEYYEEFLRLNDVEIAPVTPIGEGARNLRWPSCLYVRPAQEGERTVVTENDSADKIYIRLTGGRATRHELESYFGAPISELKLVHPGDALETGHVTAAVQVKPTTDIEEFEATFKALVDADPGTKARIVAGDIIGEIVLPIEDDGIASSAADCIPGGPPFDAAWVEAALRHSRERRDALEIFPGQAKVIVVDNGFRGIDLDAEIDDSDPFIGSPFEKRFFQADDESIIARKISIGRPYWPVIANSASNPSTQGHGTHVAGLVLGGPEFRNFRQNSENVVDTWSKLTVLNVSDGERSIAYAAVEALRGYLGVPDSGRIVNMSISFDGSASRDVATAFDGMIRYGNKTLFVVAAGNQFRNVSGDIYPAALGALQTDNVLTVSAIGGDGKLTLFSNFGSKTVDIAAPGCQIHSWVDSRQEPVPLSGTSQATPIVTFAASLIHSLAPRLPPSAMKARLVTSGDLMHPDDHGKTAYLTVLNIPKSLLVFDDYLATRGEDPVVYLGKATRMSGVRCSGEPAGAARRLDEVWSLKRSGSRLWLYAGRNTGEYGKVQEPCTARAETEARLLFVPKYRVTDVGIDKLGAVEEQEFPLADISEFVARARATN